MDVLAAMLYEADFRSQVKSETERYIKGSVRCCLDRDNDRFVVSVLDPHNRVWQYFEYGMTEKLYSGMPGKELAGRFIQAYQKKIFRDYFR